MAYSAQKHEVFSQRCKNLACMLQNLREECARLDAIYVNETASGTNEFFTDTSLATENEHVNVILLCRAFKDFFENAAVSTVDRQIWLTPFLSNGS